MPAHMAEPAKEIKFCKFDDASGGSLIGRRKSGGPFLQWNRGQLAAKVLADPENGRCRQMSGDP